MVGNLYGDEAAAAGSRPRDWSREDFSSSSTTNFRRESKILYGENFNRGKYGNFLIETEIPHSI